MGVGVSDLFARWSPGYTTAEGKAFVQARIGLYCKLMFWSFVGLLGFLALMYEVYPVTRPEHANWIYFYGAPSLAMLYGAGWLARRPKLLSARMIYGLDIAAAVMIGSGFAASALLTADRHANAYSSFIWGSFAVFGRVLIIPSSGRRSAVMASMGIAPMMVPAVAVDIDVPTPALIVGTLLFCVVVVVLSATGSHVIYGLRAQVKKAMQLGQYTIDRKIGEGGMGAVYRARHAMLRRPTAIKLLRPDRTGTESLTRFEREVQITSQLTHPNTVAIYDFGRSPEGVFYYAMEYLDGIDLETLVQESGAQPAARVIHILRQVCGALREAHGQGLIHRDIKPGNIILCNRGGAPDVAKVVDFGLVRELDREASMTASDVVTGTPAYLSPEAIKTPFQVGPQSDLYALGAVGYYLLTAEVVFAADSVVEMCMHHVATEPVRPSQRTNREIPAGLEDLLMSCLSKKPEDRPKSAAALRAALSELAEARLWTEEVATEWWAEYEAGRGKEPQESAESSLSTMTVDFSERPTFERVVLPAAAQADGGEPFGDGPTDVDENVLGRTSGAE